MGPLSPNIKFINHKPSNQYEGSVYRNADSHAIHSNLECHNHQAYF